METKIYYEFRRNNKGINEHFVIKDLSEEYFEEVITYLGTMYIHEEPMCKYSGCPEDPNSIEELKEIWREVLNFKLSLLCTIKTDNGMENVVGFNLLYPINKNDPDVEAKNPITKKIFHIMETIERIKNVFNDFKCTKYLSGLGLFVLKDYRGRGIGQEILLAREFIAKLKGFKTTLTVFTAPASQKQAERVGFHEYITMTYEDFTKLGEDLDMPGIEEASDKFKFMYKIY